MSEKRNIFAIAIPLMLLAIITTAGADLIMHQGDNTPNTSETACPETGKEFAHSADRNILIPEPCTVALVTLGATLVGIRRYRRT